MNSSSSTTHRKTQTHRRTATWCCSFKGPPKSPESIKTTHFKKHHHLGPTFEPTNIKPNGSYPSSPLSSKTGLSLVGRIDPRRILSPGRVSPIDSDPVESKLSNVVTNDDGFDPIEGLVEVGSTRKSDSGSGSGRRRDFVCEDVVDEGLFDVRLSLKGKNGGGFLVLEANSKVIVENSSVFGELISDCRKGLSGGGNGRFCRIEVPEIENLGVFRQTIELMFDKDVTNKLIKFGAHCVIDILEVSARIKFNRGVTSCLKYIEAVPWTEEEEEKLRRLFTKVKFDNEICKDILARLNLPNSCGTPQKLATQLVRSITSCDNAKARNELKSMVKGLLSKSSVYDKDHVEITKEDLYSVSQSCLSSLVMLFQDAFRTNPNKPLIEYVSWQVENINWLLEILLDHQIAEEFVDIWVNQKELLKLHERASPMVRYELSRVSALLFVAMGTRKLQCRVESRLTLLQSWFGPMLLDFGWLQRCRKGLDMKELEEGMGQALLTLPLKHQYELFMEWFRCFSKHGTECPNLSKAFQIWWRRSSLRRSESHAIESR